MYIVTIENGGVKTEIHGEEERLASGSIVKGINTIDAFSFSLFPSNVGFNLLHEFTTLVKVYNTRKERYEFYGRVLYSNPSMDESGLVKKQATCESYLGFFCDSYQPYVAEKNWTVRGLLNHIVDTHNSQIEEYKRFKVGEVTVTDPNDNLWLGIQRGNSWDVLQEKLVDRLGGEFRFRVEEDGLYLDYLTEIGTTSQTEIRLSHNMKTITKENDPSQYVTRLIPLGAKLSNDTEERLDITSVNGGKEYIDDEQAIALYGLHVGYKEWDSVTEAANLLRKAKEWLAGNNRVLVKYAVTALDLSLIDLDIDDFDVCNKHPIVNPLLGIDDVSRITKKTINVCEETKSAVELGDTFKNLSDLQVERDKKLKEHTQSVSELKSSTGSLGGRMSGAESNIEGLDNRMTTAEINIDESDASIQLIATELRLDEDGNSARLSSAEIRLDGIEAEIVLKATKTEMNSLEGRVDEAEASIKINADEIETKVSKNGVISSINQTAESITISASKVNLNGYVTASQLSAEVADLELSISDSITTRTLNVTGATSTDSLHADSCSVGSLRVDGQGISLSSQSVVYDVVTEVTTSGGTVTGVKVNDKKTTIYYLDWE